MKTRVIVKNGKFVPQIKDHWYSFWKGICKGCVNSYLGIYLNFDTLDEAIKELNDYKIQMKDNEKVVWKD